MKSQTPRTVFLSHASADKDFARRLATDIGSYGFSVWFDEWELRVGDSLIQRIEEGIQESEWMIVVLSPKAVASEWVLKELRSGLTREIGSKKVFVLPALSQKTELPSFLQDKFYADFTDSYEAGLALIIDRLRRQYQAGLTSRELRVWDPTPKYLAERVMIAPGHLSDLARSNVRCLMSYVAKFMQAWLPDNSIPGGTELWFGRTGRLLLRYEQGIVCGDYDWHGMPLAGRIHGQREEDVIHFSWDWRMSSERGRGLFWTNIPNVLHGGWWMDYDDVDEAAIRSGRAAIPNKWEFVSVQGLRITVGHEGER